MSVSGRVFRSNMSIDTEKPLSPIEKTTENNGFFDTLVGLRH